MREGVTVYLDIPLDVLARRIAAEGTDSRPILDSESGAAYTKVVVNSITKLNHSKIFKPSCQEGTNTWLLVLTYFSTSLQAFTGLLSLSKKRARAYAKADAKASLQRMFSNLHLNVFHPSLFFLVIS